MMFPDPLAPGRLIRRYKRFLADIRLDSGETVTAHCPNPGSMLGVDAPGSEVWLSTVHNPARRLRHTWELVRVGDAFVGINTARPNALVAEAIADSVIPELVGYRSIRREVKYGRASRIDLLLEAPGRAKCLVEIKSVTLKRGVGLQAPVEFPDAVTARGVRHLNELADAVRSGARGVVLFLAQRSDSDRFTVAVDIDPAFGQALRSAVEAGVEALCYHCRVSLEAIRVDTPIGMAL